MAVESAATTPTPTPAETIRAALADLERICQRGPTVERHDLLASANKRLAWVSVDDPAASGAALEAMRDRSQAALDLHARLTGGAVSAYSYTNRTLAQLLLDGPQPSARAARADWRVALAQRCESIETATRQEDARQPSVWNATARGDMALLRLLHAGPGDAAGLAAHTEEAIARYREAFARAASERERSSVVESLGFLIDLTRPSWPSAVVDALSRLQDAIR